MRNRVYPWCDAARPPLPRRLIVTLTATCMLVRQVADTTSGCRSAATNYAMRADGSVMDNINPLWPTHLAGKVLQLHDLDPEFVAKQQRQRARVYALNEARRCKTEQKRAARIILAHKNVSKASNLTSLSGITRELNVPGPDSQHQWSSEVMMRVIKQMHADVPAVHADDPEDPPAVQLPPEHAREHHLG